MEREHPKTVGERTEAVVLARCLLRGEVVLSPFGDNQRYDLVLDRGGSFVRVQCKTGRLKGDVISFQSCSRAGGKTRRGYLGQIEMFAVFCPENGKVYMVPVEAAAGNDTSLRVGPPPLSGQIKGIRFASDFEF